MRAFKGGFHQPVVSLLKISAVLCMMHQYRESASSAVLHVWSFRQQLLLATCLHGHLGRYSAAILSAQLHVALIHLSQLADNTGGTPVQPLTKRNGIALELALISFSGAFSCVTSSAG